ncbi:MAG: hypothetical protein M0Z36_02430 [Thermaerobacter sp.]|nr:hypothetical protein [Thermaerobacter sp.]
MRMLSVGILGLGALLAACLGWHDIWHVLRQARGLALTGWFIGMAGLALMVGRRRHHSFGRLALGLALAALGLALLAIPNDSRGLLTGLRVGYAGSLLAVLPHSWRLYRRPAWRKGVSADERLSEEVL